jgi:hypothetical protein
VSPLVYLCSTEEVIQPTDAIPPIAIGLDNNPVTAAVVNMAVIF